MARPFQLCPDVDNLHSRERLNYVLGQVLGVKDFQQEQKYFLHKSQMQNRGLHGYGTVWGLDVTTGPTEKEGDKGIEIQVSPGFAIDPLGREVTIDALQCANLTTWLASPPSNKNIITTEADQPKTNLETLEEQTVYVTLCYKACETGAQPILGNPCRTDSDKEGAIQYTRTRDDFELQLRAQPPKQNEEDRVRAIADLFSKINIVPDAELDEVDIDKLRGYLESPPGQDLEPIDLPQSQAQDILRELLRYWVTNIRPTIRIDQDPLLFLFDKIDVDSSVTADKEQLQQHIKAFQDALDIFIQNNSYSQLDEVDSVLLTSSEASSMRQIVLKYWASKVESHSGLEDDCLLLAAVKFALSSDGTVDEGSFIVENNQRPYLLQTRLLQELLIKGIKPSGVAQTLPTITAGSLTLGDPDDKPSVVDSDPGPDVKLDFVIPRSQTDPLEQDNQTKNELRQLVFYPTDFLLLDEEDGFPGVGDAPAILSHINGHPALLCDGVGHALFSALRPIGITPNQPPQLKLYCASEEEITAVWNIDWRWRKSLGFNFNPSSDSDNTIRKLSNLSADNYSRLPQPLEMNLPGSSLQQSKLSRLSFGDEDSPESDYLTVLLEATSKPRQKFYLLMAELIWGNIDDE